MNCPNCESPSMRTVETFNTAECTFRTKECRVCAWKYTSHERLADEYTIPTAIRRSKRKPSQQPEESAT